MFFYFIRKESEIFNIFVFAREHIFILSYISSQPEIDANSFISGYEELSDSITAKTFEELSIPQAASAERFIIIYWILEEKIPQLFWPFIIVVRVIKGIGKEKDVFNEEGVFQHQTKLMHILGSYYIKKIDRILIVARETLDIGALKKLPTEVQGQLDGVLAKYELRYTDPKKLRKRLERDRFYPGKDALANPFFGKFLSGCVRQITDTIATAGVAVLQEY